MFVTFDVSQLVVSRLPINSSLFENILCTFAASFRLLGSLIVLRSLTNCQSLATLNMFAIVSADVPSIVDKSMLVRVLLPQNMFSNVLTFEVSSKRPSDAKLFPTSRVVRDVQCENMYSIPLQLLAFKGVVTTNFDMLEQLKNM